MVDNLQSMSLSRRAVLTGAGALTTATVFGPDAALAHGPDARTDTHAGKEVKFGNGTARLYARVSRGRTQSLSVFLTSGTMGGFPERHDYHDEFILPMPAATRDCAVKFVTVGFNPFGHEPNGVFDVPHVDLHFYLISQSYRSQIDPKRSDFKQRSNAKVPAGAMPKDFVRLMPPDPPKPKPALQQSDFTIPQMGLHWDDRRRGARATGRFDHEFINGSWDGRWIFLEPMITKKWFESHQSHADQIKQPQFFPTKGEAYPTSLDIRWSDKPHGWFITLAGMRTNTRPSGEDHRE